MRCQCDQRIAVHALYRPAVHGPCADGAVEIDGGRVPVQHRPFEPRAIALYRQASEGGQQRFASATAARLRIDEEVFEIDARTPLERGEIVEEKRETDRLVVLLRDQHFGHRPRSEEVPGEDFAVGAHFVGELFIFGQSKDEAVDQVDVVRFGIADGDGQVTLPST